MVSKRATKSKRFPQSERADMANNIVMEIARYSPEQQSEPTFESYEVPVHKEWVVLDALNHIKDTQDGTLTYRWSCRMGICGSCGMMVNGEPKLACATFLSSYAKNGTSRLRVEPLRYFPIVRDLVVEVGEFVGKLKKAKPWLIRQEEKPLSAGEYLQTPQQLDDYKQYSMCINCTLCYAACPVVGLDPGFIGPAAMALAQRYNKDSRDQGSQERLAALAHPDGIWGCTFVGECTRVCPKHVDPAGAIQQYKLTAAFHYLKSLLMPRGQNIEEATYGSDLGSTGPGTGNTTAA
jgi:fumarate reductase iron-sulfur subunit